MEIEGMTTLNKDTYSKSSHDMQQYEVSHITKAENVNTFTIKKKEGIEQSKQTGAGVVVNAKRPKQFKFKSFEESLLKPVAEGEFALQVIDLSKFGHSENLHAGFLALLDYQSVNQKLVNIEDNIDSLVSKAKDYLKQLGEFDLNEDLIKVQIKYSA